MSKRRRMIRRPALTDPPAPPSYPVPPVSAIPTTASDSGSPLDRLAARALPQPLLLVDVMQSRVIAANPFALAMAGTDEATLRAQPLSHWLLESPGPDDRRPAPAAMSGASAAGTRVIVP